MVSQIIKRVGFLVTLILGYACISNGQVRGINFGHELNWDEVLKRAKIENKNIFIDCYATWCGPCKMMSNSIFPQEKVGAYVNEHFLSVKMQFDSTFEDQPYTIGWRLDRKDIQQEYNIDAYPTFLFFNPEGKLIHKVIGAKGNAEEFLQMCKDALDPNKQYSGLLKRYRQGERGAIFLRELVHCALEAGDRTTGIEVSDDFVNSLDNPYTRENINVIKQIIGSEKSMAFKLYLHNPKKIDSILNEPGGAKAIIRFIVYEKVVHPPVLNAFINNKTVDWGEIADKARRLTPDLTDEIILKEKVDYLQQKKDWTAYSKKFIEYLRKYGNTMNHYTMNLYLWDIFLHTTDIEILNYALPWSKKSIIGLDGENYFPAVDTYANLLYKAGKIKEAIIWEEKALNNAIENNNATDAEIYNKAINKMRKREPTWL